MKKFKVYILLATFIPFGMYASEYDYKTEQLKAELKKGFFTTCLPTITSQIDRAGLAGRISETQKVLYCTCVSIKIFDDMSAQEVSYIMDKGELPGRKTRARKTYSEECTDSEFI